MIWIFICSTYSDALKNVGNMGKGHALTPKKRVLMVFLGTILGFIVSKEGNY
jgi:hypothetical protein